MFLDCLESRYEIFCYNSVIITRLLVIYGKTSSPICSFHNLIVCSWLNDVAPSNISSISITHDIFQLFSGWLNDVAFLNISVISLTLLIFQSFSG